MTMLTSEALWWITCIVLLSVLWPLFPFVWIFVVAYSCWYYWHFYGSNKTLKPAGKAIFVTGCDSGFGHAIALKLESCGFFVFAGCLFPDGDGARSLQSQCSSNLLRVLDLDVANPVKVDNCAIQITDVLNEIGYNGLWALYNNAGVSSAGEVEWLPEELLKNQVEINMFGPFRVTKSVLPLIRKAKGRVVTITTGLARAAYPGRSPYCIGKFGVEAMMDCLRWEMNKFGVHCATINPGNFAGTTQIFAGVENGIDKLFDQLSPSVKHDYGESYLQAFKNSICGSYMKAGVSSSISLVEDAVMHALTSEKPRKRYKPMQFGWMCWDMIMQMLPNQITDRLVAFWITDSLPQPASQFK